MNTDKTDFHGFINISPFEKGGLRGIVKLLTSSFIFIK
jgi:hypothetical protein